MPRSVSPPISALPSLSGFPGAKRIGLLFSEAKLDWILDPSWTKDIDDIEVDGENFSDGCGLISRKLLVRLARHRRIIFRGLAYTPCVLQIRYDTISQPEHESFSFGFVCQVQGL